MEPSSLQREWSRSREPTARSTPRFVVPQQPSFPLPQAQRRPPVAKTVTTGPVLVFVAGVEGTGHHMLCAALTPRHPHCRDEPCFKVDKRLDALVRQCPNAPMHHVCANAPMRCATTPMCQCANADTRPRLHSERRVARRSRGAARAAARLPPATERARQRLASADDDAVHGHARLGSRFETLVPRRHAVPRARLRESAARVLHEHPHVHSRRHVHTCMRLCMCKQTHHASYPSGRRARRPRTPTWRCSPSLPRRRASTCASSPSRASWRAPPALACSPTPPGPPPGRRSPRSTGGERSRPAIPTAVEHH